jgi:outer membrane immunogenic protein
MKNLILIIYLASASLTTFAASSFEGPYAGLYVGYANADAKGTEYNDNSSPITHPPGQPSGYSFKNNSVNSGLIGGFVGFNKVLENNILIGAEADYEFRNGDKTSLELLHNAIPSPYANYGYSVKSELTDAVSLRAKLGYIFNDNQTLVYITSGYAAAKLKSVYTDVLGNDSNPPGASQSHSKWHNGWTTGFGVEHFVNDKVSIKGEYRYSDYSNENDITSFYESIYRVKVESENLIRVGATYHF